MMEVEVILLDFASVLEGDKEGLELSQTILPTIFDHSCNAAEFVEQRSKAVVVQQQRECLRNKLTEKVKRYLRTTDRYTALASILLKSQSFHCQETTATAVELAAAAPGEEEEPSHRQQRSLPIVDLPRTKYGKPFIPKNSNTDGGGSSSSSSVQTNGRDTLSISHQEPFVGVARSIKTSTIEEKHLGLDIVVFDDKNSCTEKFVDDFQSVFAPAEFSSIRNAAAASALAFRGENNATEIQTKEQRDFVLLREFYLRWAVKESYTKALGLGMSYEFANFETKWSWENGSSSLWEWLAASCSSSPAATRQQQQHSFSRVGTVVPVKSTAKEDAQRHELRKEEKWLFRFEPLFGNKNMANEQPRGSDEEMIGCACICIGPLGVNEEFIADEVPPENATNTDASTLLDVRVQWTSLEKLMAWHHSPSSLQNK